MEVDPASKFSVMVWAGIIGNRVIGPFFFEQNENVNAENYEDLLRHELPNLLQEAGVAPNIIARMWFMQDGAGPHRANTVINTLNELYPNRWIGVGGPQFWPPYSPDLTPLDFFLWGYIKNIVYRNRPRNRHDLINSIRAAFRSVTAQQLRNEQRSFVERFRLCYDVEGGHIETFIKCHNCNYLKNL